MEGDHESRLSKLEQRADHADEALRSLGAIVQDHGAHRERLDGLGRDVDRLGEKVRDQDEKQDQKRDALQGRIEGRLSEIETAIEEDRRERKSDKRRALGNALSILTALVGLAGLIVLILQFSGVGGG